MLQIEQLVKEFLTNKKVVGLVKFVKPLDVLKLLVKDHDICPKDAAVVTLDLLQKSDPVQFESWIREGLPLSSWKQGMQFPVSPQMKKKKEKIEEISPLRGEPEFQKHLFPPEHHRSLPKQFPYDSATVRWSRVRGQTPKAGHKT